jgi:hypothetical protein
MGFAIRKHILEHYTGAKRKWGAFASGTAGVLSGMVFVGQIVGKWTEGGWVVLISFGLLVLGSNALLISPIGFRDPKQIHRIVRDKARIQGAMASIVEWQSLRMQEYRYSFGWHYRFFELFEFPPVRYGYLSCEIVTMPCMWIAEAPSLLEQYLKNQNRNWEALRRDRPVEE